MTPFEMIYHPPERFPRHHASVRWYLSPRRMDSTATPSRRQRPRMPSGMLVGLQSNRRVRMDTTLYDWAAEATGALELPESARWVGDRDRPTAGPRSPRECPGSTRAPPDPGSSNSSGAWSDLVTSRSRSSSRRSAVGSRPARARASRRPTRTSTTSSRVGSGADFRGPLGVPTAAGLGRRRVARPHADRLGGRARGDHRGLGKGAPAACPAGVGAGGGTISCVYVRAPNEAGAAAAAGQLIRSRRA
jgi:hypothetical protein